MVRGVDKQKLPISIVDLRNDAEEYVKNTLKKDM
jgi:hypothetical protein